MSQATITFRTDAQTKEHFDKFCSDVGMNASVAFNMFMRATLNTGALPFRVSRHKPIVDDAQFFSGANLDRLMRAKARVEAGMTTDHELLPEDD